MGETPMPRRGAIAALIHDYHQQLETLMRCPTCREENAEGVLFCRRCGGKLAPPGRVPAGKAMIVGGAIALAVCIAACVAIFALRSTAAGSRTSLTANSPSDAPGGKVRIGVAYGTEKKDWFTWAAGEFAKTPEGQGVQIDLKGMGSLESAQAIVKGDASIHVWSPAGAMYRSVFARDWAAAHPDVPPFVEEQPLALTPMVFVMWQERYEAFAKKYPEVSFKTVAAAMAEPGGWDAIAGKPDWGFFKFSHTHPNQSNSGLVSLVLAGNDFHGSPAPLGGRQITDARFQAWLTSLERNLVGAASGLIPSTGTLMTAMVQRGWSTYDCVLVYESTAVDRLRQANGRWGALRVVYPKYNLWSDHPYYVLNAPWCSPEQKRAAAAFLRFLLAEPAQQEAIAHGFRPANVNVPTNGPDSPFTRYADVGLQANVPGIFCEPPSADALESLLLGWQRSNAGR
jgi:hypothetical protein